MRQTSRAIGLVLVVLSVGGCGGSSSSPTATVSGPFAATLFGTLHTTSGSGGIGSEETGPNLVVTFGGSSGNASSGSSLVMSVVLPGNSPQTGTFDSSNSLAAESSLSLFLSAGAPEALWTQFFQAPLTVGSFSLALTAAGSLGGASSASPGRTEWLNPHGTLSVTLPPDPSGGEPSEGTAVALLSF
jgi:hypothetical protein